MKIYKRLALTAGGFEYKYYIVLLCDKNNKTIGSYKSRRHSDTLAKYSTHILLLPDTLHVPGYNTPPSIFHSLYKQEVKYQ